jgi:tight adherence protein C
MIMPQLWLNARLRKRHRAMLALLPEVVDLLALCMGAGLDFLSALKRVAAIKAFQRHPLMEELAGTLQEIRVGKRRSDALRAMARRVNLPELTSFVRTLVQADRMGTPLGEVLAIHSEDVRFQRFMRAERAALKAPIKILIPLIFFILPCVALVVGAPIFIQFSKQNPFAK